MNRNRTLLVGAAKRDITPPAGELIACFPDKPNRRARVAEGVQYPIMAKALALDGDGTGVVLCALDVAGLQWPDVRDIRRAAASQTGLPTERILLFATHTHHGPECLYYFGGAPADPCIARMRDLTCDAVVEAWQSRKPARLGAGTTRLEENYNRRKILGPGRMEQWSTNPDRTPNGPVDPTLSALCVAPIENSVRHVLFNWTAHALVMNVESKLFSADFPGAAAKRIAQRLGEPNAAIFANGCAGNVHPYAALTNSVAEIERLGERLADATLSICERVQWAGPALLRFRSEIIRFPHRLLHGAEAEAELAALALGRDIAFVFVPGDPFVEIQLALRAASPFPNTFVIGYASGWVGYVPMEKDFEYGGYGVDKYPFDLPEISRTRLPRGAGDRIRDRAIELLRGLSA